MKLKFDSLSIALTLFAAVMFLISSSVLINNYVVVDWERTIAVITSSEVNSRLVRVNQSNSRVFRVCLTYQFEINGVSYGGRDCGSLGEFSERSDADSAELSYRNKSNGLIEILYNLDDPSESTVPTANRFRNVWLLFGASFVFLAYRIAKWKRSKLFTVLQMGMNCCSILLKCQ